jgi:imidazoleglycerol phosphate synthase cyclase subunit
MLTRRIIPCLDVRDGRVVKGTRFQGLRDVGDPAACAQRYEDEGADEIVMLDVSATPEGRAACLDTVRAVRAVLSIPLTVGGGVRAVTDAEALLEAGADRVAVNSAAVCEPALLDVLAGRFGRQCIVIAVDAQRNDSGWEVVIESGRTRTGLDVPTWCAEAARRGAGEVLLTSWDRDGTLDGYDLDLVRAVRRAVPVPVIASGGAAGPAHCVDALRAGADAVLAASIFHDGRHAVGTVKQELARAGVEVRT